jgi:hypothetical protein
MILSHHFLIVFIYLNAPQSVQQQNLKEYCNDRFSFCINYPNTFIGQGESGNGDGQLFLPKDKQAEITTYGMLVLEEVNDDFNEQFKQAGEGLTVTYKVFKANWFIVSGTDKKGNIVYRKTVLKKISYMGDEKEDTSVLQTLMITYPPSQQKIYGSYCGVIAKSL